MTDAAVEERASEGNRLGRETSPYLLQHQENPVHWWAWGPEALAEAKRTGKPILLSVGYAACHWCHVMAHESFEDGETAARDERPLRQHQGRPRGAPGRRRDLHGGAARARRAGRLAAHHVPHLRRRAVLGRHLFPQGRALRPAGLHACAEGDRAHLSRRARQGAAERRRAEAGGSRRSSSRVPARSRATRRSTISPRRLLQLVDPTHGGIRGAPKFPQPQFFNFLWRAGLRYGLPNPHRGGRRSPSPISRKAASTIISAAASPATAWTSAGSCRISRRCSTTTRCCSS